MKKWSHFFSFSGIHFARYENICRFLNNIIRHTNNQRCLRIYSTIFTKNELPKWCLPSVFGYFYTRSHCYFDKRLVVDKCQHLRTKGIYILYKEINMHTFRMRYVGQQKKRLCKGLAA